MKDNEIFKNDNIKKVEKTISLVAIIILVLGLSIGGFLIYNGVAKPGVAKIEDLKEELENKKNELESKGVRYDSVAKYTDGEAYDLKIIINALDPSFSRCSFSEYKDNPLTKKYCAVKNGNDEFASSFKIGIGVFICIATFMISGSIFMFSKQRHILSFQANQIIPVAKQGIDEIAPSLGNLASEIARGRKEGEENARVAHVVKCQHCGADNEIIGKTGVCEYCKSKISFE